MGASRNVATTDVPMRGISVNPDDGDVTTINVVPSDSGVMFMNKETGGATTYNLPAVADAKGKIFWFFNAQTSKNIVINAPANTMFMADDIAASSATATGEACGDCGFVVCDGSSYYFLEFNGTWASA